MKRKNMLYVLSLLATLTIGYTLVKRYNTKKAIDNDLDEENEFKKWEECKDRKYAKIKTYYHKNEEK